MRVLKWRARDVANVEDDVDGGRRNFFKRAIAFTAVAGGFVPSVDALAQSAGQFEVRRPMVNPLEMWLYTIHMPPEFLSTWMFGGVDKAPAIPADFFGAGSDPWMGAISCVGIPLDRGGHTPTADLVVRHETVDWIPNPNRKYGPREIPRDFRIRCEMKQLSERVPDPITVTYNQGRRGEKWDVVVTIAKDHPGGGYIDITWINGNGNGGLCDIEIAVKVDFTFTRVASGGQRNVTVLKSDVEWLAETNHPFARWADVPTSRMFSISPGAHGNFIPAARDLGGQILAAGSCSKNSTVVHSFTLAPKQAPLRWGTLDQIRQFAPRKE